MSRIASYAVSRFANYAVSRLAEYAVSRLAKYAVSRLAKYAVSRLAEYVVSRLVDYAVSSRDLLTTQLADYALFALATRLAVSRLYQCGCAGHIQHWVCRKFARRLVGRRRCSRDTYLPRVIYHQVY